ncbi:MAG: hypothetical protein ACE5GA_06855, partial [Candidatus Zixiibacteriota bacterium]
MKLAQLTLSGLLVAIASTASAADLILSTSLTIPTDTTFDSVVIQSGGILTADGVIMVLNDMRIESGGIVTHTLRDASGLVLDVT